MERNETATTPKQQSSEETSERDFKSPVIQKETPICTTGNKPEIGTSNPQNADAPYAPVETLWKQHPIEEKGLTLAARILSSIFNPFMVPFLAFFLLFFFTYLRIMPLQYKLIVLGIVYSFTILMPMLFIYLFQKISGEGIRALSERKKRFVPYALTLTSYLACLFTMYKLHIPRYLSGIIAAALLCMICCTLLNFRWKISTHTASSGLLVGGLLSYSFLFQFNPIGWLCFFILLAGMLGTSRIIVKQHSLLEVFAGFVVGLFCGVIGILFI